MVERKHHIGVLILLTGFLMSLILLTSWRNPYVVKEGSDFVQPFYSFTPFLVGVLIFAVILFLIIIVVERKD